MSKTAKREVSNIDVECWVMILQIHVMTHVNLPFVNNGVIEGVNRCGHLFIVFKSS